MSYAYLAITDMLLVSETVALYHQHMTFPTSFYVDSIVNQLEHTTIGAFDDAPSILHSLHFHELANCWLLLFPYQDGSCNGLQHYAALGRDYVSVVLCCTFCVSLSLQPFYPPHDVVRVELALGAYLLSYGLITLFTVFLTIAGIFCYL